ncbi:Protein of unknown function DUF2052, coiled-coil [Cinara cedri]|uniref:CCD97-like C-terminal domain-containing protein n=1 Tax=Cinara cedri TaxID=506608 RepID=A0A5E4MPI6_9HEMI|nr:Protein of unknown function DUF2052, coiled-coil [Cinara cedri]
MMDSDIIMKENKEILNIRTNNDSETLRQSIIDHVVMKALNNVFIKSEQMDKSEFTLDEKRKITEDTLNDCHLKFLYLFGEYLLEDHLEYFKCENINNYEIHFHLHRLSRLLNSKKVICKNRRYQAMLELLKGDYFTDNEMRNREPLLWEQLVGQYLSEEEKFNCENQYITKNSLTEVLFEQIDRDNRDDLKRKQQINETLESDEDEDNDYDDDIYDTNNKSKNTFMTMEVNKLSGLWGEYNTPKTQPVTIGKHRGKGHSLDTETEQCSSKEPSKNERIVLLNEFKSHMIQKFLSGQEDFDYNNVDNNPEYDNLHIKGIDEEEKYFDSESPVEEEVPTVELKSDTEEDELDMYMSILNKNETTDSVADKFKHL